MHKQGNIAEISTDEDCSESAVRRHEFSRGAFEEEDGPAHGMAAVFSRTADGAGKSLRRPDQDPGAEGIRGTAQ